MQNSLYTSVLKSLWLNAAVIGKQIDLILADVHGISFDEYMVLHNLAMSGDNTMDRKALGESVGKSVLDITKMLNPMEKIGLVEKQVDNKKPKMKRIKLTKSGEKLFKNTGARLDHYAEQNLGVLDKLQLEDLLETLETMNAA